MQFRKRSLGLVILGFWLVIGAGFGIQLFSFYRLTGAPMKLGDAMAWEIARWATWAVLVPLVGVLSARWPLRGGSLPRLALLHTGAAVAVSAVHVLLFSSVAVAGALLLELSTAHKPLRAVAVHFFSQPDWPRAYKVGLAVDFHIGVLVYWALVIFYETLASHRRAAGLEAQLATARLDALKMQLHPHFLFNTLNSISALVGKDPAAAEDLISELADFLRVTLDDAGAREVPLSGELGFVDRYLRIEKVRFHQRLTATYDVAPDTLAALVPNLLLQPIVENAVHHGIARSEGGTVAIRARHAGAFLRLEVSDDGAGIRRNGEGIGLRNTRSRLEQLYGGAARFSLEPADGRGTRAVVELPFHTAPAAEAG